MSHDPRQLWLLRHAKAVSDHAGDDFNRPLTDSGREDAQRLADWMHLQALFPDTLLSSTATRAAQTADILSRTLGLMPGQVLMDEELYNADADTLLDVLRCLRPCCHSVLLVGHNPGLEELAQRLHDRPLDNLALMPASLIRLQIGPDWSDLRAGSAHAATLTHGRALSGSW